MLKQLDSNGAKILKLIKIKWFIPTDPMTLAKDTHLK